MGSTLISTSTPIKKINNTNIDQLHNGTQTRIVIKKVERIKLDCSACSGQKIPIKKSALAPVITSLVLAGSIAGAVVTFLLLDPPKDCPVIISESRPTRTGLITDIKCLPTEKETVPTGTTCHGLCSDKVSTVNLICQYGKWLPDRECPRKCRSHPVGSFDTPTTIIDLKKGCARTDEHGKCMAQCKDGTPVTLECRSTKESPEGAALVDWHLNIHSCINYYDVQTNVPIFMYNDLFNDYCDFRYMLGDIKPTETKNMRTTEWPQFKEKEYHEPDHGALTRKMIKERHVPLIDNVHFQWSRGLNTECYLRSKKIICTQAIIIRLHIIINLLHLINEMVM